MFNIENLINQVLGERLCFLPKDAYYVSGIYETKTWGKPYE
jgi:hypothetical protein